MEWVAELLGGAPPVEGETLLRTGRTLTRRHDVLRDMAVYDPDQAQTRDMFAFKWAQHASYGGDANAKAQRGWLRERYGDLAQTAPEQALVLDAGCGAGYAATLLFGERLRDLRYVGVDISTAVDIASAAIRPIARASLFLQGDLLTLPFKPASFDLVFSEGVMHHTPSTRDALLSLARHVKPGGRLAFYVYAKKAPVREFTDDHVRERVASMSPEQAWEALMPLSELGRALGDLNAEVDVPRNVDVLGIPAGRINVQRLFYYYVCKAFYRPDFDLDELNHINFDWFTPKYCHRQTPEEVRAWCEEAGLSIEMMRTELSGVTVIARAS